MPELNMNKASPPRSESKPSSYAYPQKNYGLDEFDQLHCAPTLSSESSSRGDTARTELSDMFDPAALPFSDSLDRQSLSTKDSSDAEENDKDSSKKTSKKSNTFRRIKFKSPIKVLSRKKKSNSQTPEDMDIFEEKNPIDLLNDDGMDDPITNNTESVLPFTTMSKDIKSGTGIPVAPQNQIPNYNTESVLPFRTMSNIKNGTGASVAPPNPIPNYRKIESNLPNPSLKTISGKPLVSREIPRPSSVKAHTRASSFDKVIQLFTAPKEKESDVDFSIGLRLALPDKLGIMTGTTPIKEESNKDTPSKKLMIVPTAPRFAKSPFKRKPAAKPPSSDLAKPQKEDAVSFQKSALFDTDKREIVLRTSELEPSVHQVSIPEATDLLIHARICSLMEGYDKLLETRAKAGKRWFSFGHLVGLPRKDLENMYLAASGKTPAIPMYIGEEAENLPPPLPNIVNGSFNTSHLGNPFDSLGNDGQSLTSLKSIHSTESNGIVPNSYPRKRTSSVPKGMKPHPSTIRSLLECCDDLTVEGYFNETIGNDNELIEDIESTSVQVTVFASQRCRQFIICYRGSIGLHSKPIRKNTPCELDSNGINNTFGNSYLPELETRVFELVQKLSTENPFFDIVFTGHSFGGSLSLIAAVRCAEKYQDMTVSFHGFGVPKVGQSEFRRKSHSLPNLKVFRLENCLDMYVHLPADPWEHAGHTISINYSKNKKRTVVNPGNEGETVSAIAIAYKFGKKDLGATKSKIYRVRKTIDARAKKTQSKSDHEMRNYLHALEHFTHMGSPWVSSFANELGTGIVTKENEARMVV